MIISLSRGQCLFSFKFQFLGLLWSPFPLVCISLSVCKLSKRQFGALAPRFLSSVNTTTYTAAPFLPPALLSHSPSDKWLIMNNKSSVQKLLAHNKKQRKQLLALWRTREFENPKEHIPSVYIYLKMMMIKNLCSTVDIYVINNWGWGYHLDWLGLLTLNTFS